MRGLAETETEAEAVLGLSESVSVLRVLLAATAVLVSVLLVWRRQKLKQRRRAARHVQDPRYCTFPLMQSECMGLERTGSVSTLTVFEGDCAAAEVWVRRRTLEVIRANPWLTGRLLSSVNRHSPFRVCHRKEVTAEDANNHVLTLDDPLLDARNLDQAIKSHANHLVRRGIDCIDTDQQLFKIIFSRVSADSFALVLSLSHMLGDGSTYYKIFSMFSNKENVIALKAERNEELQRKSFHMSRAPDLFGSFLFKLRMISFALQPKTASRAFIADVDQMWIIEEKKTHKKMIKNDASNHFVSTNDLLVSWFANIVGLDFLLMAMDSRGRSPVMKDDAYNRAGNYLIPLLFLKMDMRSPSQIRKTLQYVSAESSPRGQAGFRTETDAIPSPTEILKLNCGLTSNWATFYRDINFPNPCTVQHHTPFNQRGLARHPHLLVIFRRKADTLSVLISTQSVTLQNAIENGEGPILLGSVSRI